MDSTHSSFTTSLPVRVLCRQQLPSSSAGPASFDWRELDQGPGFIQIPTGEEASLKARNLDDDLLRQMVSEISGCEAIAGLDLAENRNVSDAGLAHLVRLPWLRYLSLRSCGLTDRGLVHLLALPSLEVLDLSYCNRITNDGVLRLKALSCLRYLDLQGCVRLNNRSLSKLRREGLTIHHRTIV
jgi:hypothetical protein